MMTQYQHLSWLQVREVVSALGSDEWTVQFVPSDTANGSRHADRRTYTQCQILYPETIKYLRYRNGQGDHVYFRPNTNRHIRIDDLDADAIDRLKADRLRPALVVGTSKANYQAWLSLAPRSDEVDAALATQAARLVTRRYGGDPGAVNSTAFGRLPGFRNRKDIYRDGNGGYPLVQVTYWMPGVAPAVPSLLDEVRALIASDELRPSPCPQGACAPGDTGISTAPEIDPTQSSMTPDEAMAIYAATEAEVRVAMAGRQWDCSRSGIDYHVAWRLAHIQRFEATDIVVVLQYGSPRLCTLASNVEYIGRTLSRVYRSAPTSKSSNPRE